MTEATRKADTPFYIVAARHLVGLTALLALNPLHGIGSNWFTDLLTSLVGMLVITSLLWGIYALFFTATARRQWPTGFFVLAWVFSALALLGFWSDYDRMKTASKSSPQPAAPVTARQPPAETKEPASPAPAPAAITLEQAALEIARAYPYLDTPEGQRALELIIVERDALIARGVDPVQALYSAAQRIAPEHQPRASNKP